MSDTRQLTRFERLLSLTTTVQPGEGRCVAALCSQALALMTAYYLIRPVREALILTEGSAELRSYAVGAQALLLILIIPAYGALMRHVDTSRVFQRINAFFAANLVVFFLLGQAGLHFGFVFFVWTSIFGVMTVTQFWAFATDLFNAKSGQRLFGVIAIGVSGGAWIGSRLASAGFDTVGPYGLMLGSAVILVGAIALSKWARASVPATARSLPQSDDQVTGRTRSGAARWLGGFTLIARSRYLLGIAVLVVLLNWITATGEFVLSHWLAQTAREVAPASPTAFIGHFMSNYCASITLVGFLIQLLLVSRIIMKAGLARALLVTPVAFLVGYLLIGIVPVFALLQSVLVVQRSLDYSLLNTSRSALLLPTSREVKYQAKTAIDTFFYRLGDLLSTASVFVGLKVCSDPRTQFIWLIVILSAVMTLVAWLIGREYARRFTTEREPSTARTPVGSAASVVFQQ
ncbi:MAG TPA: Npt1/Npt2 family nucleotide transporter [Steroidobacteraceae bacterium]|nr:Npt1/Npt2 family nucleotide transporter [Steroidobacteraceae bacterium]